MKKITIIILLLFFAVPYFTNAKVIKSIERKRQNKIILKHYGVKDKWFGFDKLHHFYYSASLTGLSYLTAHYVLKCDNGDKGRTRFISASSVFALGVLKECYDRTHSSTGFSYKDLTFDLIGVLSGVALFTLYER